MYRKQIQRMFSEIVCLDMEIYYNQESLQSITGTSAFSRPPTPAPYDTYRQENASEVFAADCADLSRLHAIVRHFKVLTVLELGSGLSTGVIAHALKKNKDKYKDKISLIRRKDPFKVYSVECAKNYMASTERIIGNLGLSQFVEMYHGSAELTYYNGSLCGQHKSLPTCCPDFIYIDGPSPYSYEDSNEHVISLSHPDITNVTCDLLRIEHLLLPGTVVVFDGMTNNARFNTRNLNRNWLIHESTELDYTLLVLDEEPLGVHHKNHLRFVQVGN